MGPAQLGIYGRAYATMMLPIREISSVLGKVLFPALSRISADKPQVKQLYLRWLAIISFLAFPMMAFFFAAADTLILTLYGPAWAGVVPVLRIFCVVGAFQSLGTTVGWIYQSQGRTDLMFRWGLGAGGLMIASIVVGVWLGSIEAVALCYAVMTVGILSYPQFAIPGRLIGLRALEVGRAVARVAACAAIMGVAVWSFGKYLVPELVLWAKLPLELLLGSSLYYGLARVLAPQQLGFVRQLISGETTPASISASTDGQSGGR
jgi:PST family polysaccharide transporter